MILFVFEGVKEEPRIMATVKELFFKDRPEMVQCAYGSDTHTFVKEVKELAADDGEVDVFAVVRERMHQRGDHSLDAFSSHDFSDIFLFFDYDPQNRTIPLEQLNAEISDIIDILSSSGENGAIFISYPMVEALYCENSIPDKGFNGYTVPIDELAIRGKAWAECFDCDRKRDMVIFKTDKSGKKFKEEITSQRRAVLRRSWIDLVHANAAKANLICNDNDAVPVHVEDIATRSVFDQQLGKFVIPTNSVSILSAFPLFLFDYFHGNGEM